MTKINFTTEKNTAEAKQENNNNLKILLDTIFKGEIVKIIQEKNGYEYFIAKFPEPENYIPTFECTDKLEVIDGKPVFDDSTLLCFNQIDGAYLEDIEFYLALDKDGNPIIDQLIISHGCANKFEPGFEETFEIRFQDLIITFKG